MAHHAHIIHEWFAKDENLQYVCPKLQWENQAYYRECGLQFTDLDFGVGQLEEGSEKLLKAGTQEYVLRKF